MGLEWGGRLGRSLHPNEMEPLVATTQEKTSAALAGGYTTDEQFLATRYKQGGRTVYAIALSPAEIAAIIKKPDPKADNPGNRRIRLDHAEGFARYFIENDTWVVPGIILRAPSMFAFQEQMEIPGASFGLVSYPRRKSSDLHILDGQHRILGFHLAEEMIADQLDKARSARATAKRTEGDQSVAYRDAMKQISHWEAVQERFGTERVSVEIKVTDDLAEYRQMFFDIAENALGITASVKARFDSRKVVNRALAPVLEHPLLANRVDLELDRVRRANPNLLSAKNVTEIIRATIVGFDGRVSRRQESEFVDTTVARSALDFFDGLVAAFPQFKAVELGQILPTQLRSTSLLGSALFLRILAGVWWDLITQHAWPKAKVVEFFAALAPHMEAPVHENSIWKTDLPDEIFTIGQNGPNGQRQATMMLVKALVDWAIIDSPVIHQAPAPAPVVEPDPDEGIDFAPDHTATLKALGVELTLEHEEIAKTHKQRARKAAPTPV